MALGETSSCRNILIVEDDEGIRDTLRYALEIEGYEVVTAANGQAALELLSRIALPCVILLDLMMPIMNGWEFADALRERDAALGKIPIVLVTAFGDQGRAINSKSIIKKPVDLDVLFRTVRKWCAPRIPE